MKTENRVKKIESILSQLELSTSEVHIYTTLLRRGPSSIAEIAKAVNMSRVNVHYLVENMLTLGILHETQQPRRRLIFVHKRAAIEALIEKKKEKMDLLAQEASTLQTFFDLINTSKKTHVRDYEGVEGMVDMFKEVANDGKDMYVISDNKRFNEVFDAKIMLDSYKKRAKKGVKTRMLFTAGFINYRKTGGPYNIHIKVIPGEIIKNSALNIRGDKIALHNLQDGLLSTVIIENAHIANTMRYFFNILWTRGKDYKI